MRYLLRPLGILAILAGGAISLYTRFTNIDQTELRLLVAHFGPFALASALLIVGVVLCLAGDD